MLAIVLFRTFPTDSLDFWKKMVMSKRIALQYVGENGDHAEAIPSFFKPLTFSDLFPENKLYEINAEVKAGDAKINGEVIKDKSTLTIPI